MGTEFEFFTPDSIMRKISITPNDCQMEVRAKEIVTRCEVRVKNEPIIPIPVKVTIQNAGQSIQRTDSLKEMNRRNNYLNSCNVYCLLT